MAAPAKPQSVAAAAPVSSVRRVARRPVSMRKLVFPLGSLRPFHQGEQACRRRLREMVGWPNCGTGIHGGVARVQGFRPARTARNTGGKELRLCIGGPIYPLYRYTPPPSKESDMTSLLSPEITT